MVFVDREYRIASILPNFIVPKLDIKAYNIWA